MPGRFPNCGFTPPAGSVVNSAGTVHIFLSADGSSYAVVSTATGRSVGAATGPDEVAALEQFTSKRGIKILPPID